MLQYRSIELHYIVLFNFKYMVIFLDGTNPLSCIGGIDDLRDVDRDEDIGASHETGALLLL